MLCHHLWQEAWDGEAEIVFCIGQHGTDSVDTICGVIRPSVSIPQAAVKDGRI